MRTPTRIAISTIVVVAALVAAFGIGWANQLAERDHAFVIDAFDQHVTIDADGATSVTEELDVTFSAERRGIFRDLDLQTPFPSLGGFTDFRVDRGDPSEPWTHAVEAGPSGPRIRIGDASVFLDPGTYHYRLRYSAPSWYYRLEDDPGTVEVRIDSPGFDWPTTIGTSTLTLTLPGPVDDAQCVEGPPRSTRTCDTPAQIDGDRATFTFGPFEDRQSATVAVQLDAEAFGQVDSLPTYDADPLTSAGGLGPWPLDRRGAAVLLAVLLMLPILAWEIVSARVFYRDRITDPQLHDRIHPTALPAPPFGFRPPEVAGLLLRTSGDPLFLSTLVDLDQRGAVTTDTATEEGGLLSRDSETLTVAPSAAAPTSMPPTDIEVVAALLPEGATTTFDGEYDKSVADRVTKVQSILTGRARSVFEAHGFAHEQGGILGRSWFRAVVTVGYLGVAALLVWAVTAATPLHPAAGIGTGAVILVTWGVLAAMWKHHRLPLTSEGRDAVAQARAFEEFVRTVEGEQLEWAAGKPGIDHLHPAVSLLPYAIALGLADSWYDRFGSVMRELAVVTGGGATTGGTAAAGGAAWWASQSSFRNVSSSQSGTSTAPSSSGGGGGGGGSGGGGGGGGSW